MIFIISYPKSGRTWFRVLVKKYEKESNTLSKESKFTHIGFGYEGNRKLRDEVLSGKKTDALINLTREPLDTLVSYYHDAHKRGKFGLQEKAKDLGIDNFCIMQVEDYLKYKSFEEKIDFDYSTSYEEMQKNTIEAVLPAFEILFDKVDKETLSKAIEYCEFENLSKLERSGKIDMHSKQNKFYKTRKGKVGSHKEELKPNTINTIKGIMKNA